MLKKLFLLLIMLLPLTLNGCAIKHKISTDTKMQVYPTFTAKGNISVINLEKREHLTISISPSTCTVNVNEIVENVKQAIKYQIIASQSAISNDQKKSIGLSISGIHVSGIFKVTICVKIVLGNGVIRGVEAKGESWNINKAVDYATHNISDKVLGSIDVLNYIEE